LAVTDRHSGCHLLGDKCGTTHTFSCKECGCEFKMKHHLRRHLESVHKVNPSQLAEFEAGNCLHKSFKSIKWDWSMIIIYLEHSTRPLNRFKCDKCMKTYKSKNNLVHHMKNECRVDPAFPCSECSYKATCKGSIRRHLIHVHNVDRSELDNFASVGNIFWVIISIWAYFWFLLSNYLTCILITAQPLFVSVLFCLSNVRSVSEHTRLKTVSTTTSAFADWIHLSPAPSATIEQRENTICGDISATFIM